MNIKLPLPKLNVGNRFLLCDSTDVSLYKDEAFTYLNL